MFRYDRLDELVKETGKKKVYLCSKLGKCATYLRDSKKQNTNIKGEDLKILAAELNTTPEYLSGETDKKEKPDSQKEVRLDEKTRRAIIQNMNAEELAELIAECAAELSRMRGRDS